ncbi:class E sortase [Arthrobacter roseus]|uniref:class E sortase n=1 Tax=Arthrobacter roseus TaxID=136274 RepID=UPI0019637AA2|nr:sortase A [Arthrobacter roseus]
MIRARRRGVLQTTIQVAGELLITLGVVLLLFVGWELWWTNIESNQKQDAAIENLLADFNAPVVPQTEPQQPQDYGDPPVLEAVQEGETFAVVYIPRFGAEYTRPVTDGVGVAVLDNLGLGHYPDTVLPGGVGNFALAGHRQTHGMVLDAIHMLVPGDRIFVQTRDGYYTYVYRNNQIVLPNRTDVIAPVPTQPGATPVERIMTLTSCNPRFGAEERIIAYSIMDSWQPLSAGPPAEIAELVANNAEKGA